MTRVKCRSIKVISQRMGLHWNQGKDTPRMIKSFIRIVNKRINKLLNSKANSKVNSSSSAVEVQIDTVGLRGLPNGRTYHNINSRPKSQP